MVYAGTNYLAILVAAVAGFAAGGAWYSLLGKYWMAALGRTAADMKPAPGPFIIAGIANIVMAWVLAGVIGHLGQVSLANGIISGALVWLGFVATTLAVNHAFQGAPRRLTLIDGGHWLLVLLIMGGVIGAFGV